MDTFSVSLALCGGNSLVTGEFPLQRPMMWSLDFSLICAWINGWVNNHEAGLLRHHHTHYGVSVMCAKALTCPSLSFQPSESDDTLGASNWKLGLWQWTSVWMGNWCRQNWTQILHQVSTLVFLFSIWSSKIKIIPSAQWSGKGVFFYLVHPSVHL